MVDRKEPVALRNKRLFRSVICGSGLMQRSTVMKMTQDALLDAFILLYDECSKESLKKDTHMTNFINKYRSLVTEIKSLRVSLSDFSMETVIGRGHFGEVRIVKEKETNDTYAMKILSKNKIVSFFEEERDIMCINSSPWLTSLIYSFQDNNNLYFIMDYHPGGDLSSLLNKLNGTFSSEMIKFYLAEIILAIRALHQMGYVHRDIKPDNILLDRCGHVKLADFGSAARLTASGTVNQSLPVGTPEYVAPEILLSLSNDFSNKKKCCYGIECDYWSLGIVAYEMIAGCTPFSGEELKVIYFNIMNHKKLKYPESLNVPETLKDLIDKLLEDQNLRIKYESLIRHPFFIGVNFSNIRNEVPPFVPILKSPDDTSNFIEVECKKGVAKIDVKENVKEFCSKHLPFIGFTFSNEKLSKTEQNADDSLEYKGNCLNSALARIRRENKNLVSKLCESELGKSTELDKLKKILEEKNKLYSSIETDRNRLLREVAKAEAENANLRQTLELERQDRKETELNALNLIRQNKIKLEKDMGNLIGPLHAKIEEINDKLTESHTLNNELISKCDRIESELTAAKSEIERLKALETSYKAKIVKIREMKRQSVVGLESRIEQLANDSHTQTNILQKKLNEEIDSKNEALEKLKELEAVFSGKEAQFKEEIQEYEDKMMILKQKIEKQHTLIASLQVKSKEKPNIALLEQSLEAEKKECARLRLRISEMESELTNTTNSFLDHEAAIAAHEENMSALEKEFRQISEEKIELEKKLEKTKEIEEENRQKLSSLEVVVDRLEEGVIKLETENAKLKQQKMITCSHPITSEAETRYQERIAILEDQIAKLNSQLQKMTESSLLEKETLKIKNSALWKAEKELSDTKIDLRIAKRETKTAEDTIAKLNDEIKKMNKKIDEVNAKTAEEIASEQAKFEKFTSKIESLESELNEREKEVTVLKNQLREFEELKTSNKQLKKEYNEMCQNLKILENQIALIKKEKGEIKATCANLEMTKVNLESVIEDMKHKICSLELNNTVLKETGSMMDEQLEDYEKFTVSQTQKIQELFQEKCFLEKELQTLKRDLSSCRQSLNEEKSFRLKAEQRVSFLEREISNAEEKITSLHLKVTSLNGVVEDLKNQIKDFDEKAETYEMEIQESKRKYDALSGECQWLKEETATHLTNLYSLRESNYKLSHNLEEEQQLTAILQDKITELQSVITELEAFHKEREIKDEATKQQQNKLINFLQSKLEETKKKKTFSNVLFGSRSKENFPPNSEWTSPNSAKTSSNLSKVKNLKVQNNSPSKKKILSQIVKSPTSQLPFQRTFSLQRMHHNIPHRFKTQLVTRTGKCESCHSNVNRGNQISVCDHCGIQAHPKCSVTIPKTCGLPESFANHYVKSLMNPAKMVEDKSDTLKSPGNAVKEGWIKIPNTDNLSWERRYAKLKGEKLFIYEHEPQDDDNSPSQVWNFCTKNKIIIGGVKETSGLPPTAKSDIPYIIKVAVVPENSCWPQNVYHIMVLTPADKPLWLSALNSITLYNPLEKFEYYGSQIYSFSQQQALHMNSIFQINDQLLLLGAEEGLFSLKLNYDCAEPIKINGISKVRQISVADHIGLVLMIAEDNGILIETDYRSLLSNAETLSCVNPSITINEISLGSAVESSLMFSVSHKIDGTVYLTVATTSSRLILLKWNMKDSQFLVSKVLETLHPCNCIIYTNNSVIVGCDKFFQISFKDYFVQEFLNPAASSLAFWKIGSFPIQIFQTACNEFLLCYNEFGVFVNENGDKILPDLKWSKAPCQFAFQKPYLFVVHKSSVEVIILQKSDWIQTNTRSNDDTISMTSTATIQDSIHINFNNPCLLGPSKIAGSIIISDISNSGTVHLILIEGKKVYRNELGSSISLSTIPSENKDFHGGDEFSFTSSVPHSYEAGSSTPRHSDESDSCNTYTISESDKKCSSKKTVNFT